MSYTAEIAGAPSSTAGRRARAATATAHAWHRNTPWQQQLRRAHHRERSPTPAPRSRAHPSSQNGAAAEESESNEKRTKIEGEETATMPDEVKHATRPGPSSPPNISSGFLRELGRHTVLCMSDTHTLSSSLLIYMYIHPSIHPSIHHDSRLTASRYSHPHNPHPPGLPDTP